MFHTLQEYLTFTKGVSYILAGLLLVCFIGFWIFLTNHEDKK